MKYKTEVSGIEVEAAIGRELFGGWCVHYLVIDGIPVKGTRAISGFDEFGEEHKKLIVGLLHKEHEIQDKLLSDVLMSTKYIAENEYQGYSTELHIRYIRKLMAQFDKDTLEDVELETALATGGPYPEGPAKYAPCPAKYSAGDVVHVSGVAYVLREVDAGVRWEAKLPEG